MTPLVEVATPQGPGRLHVAEARDPYAVLVLGHGAGGGVDAPDLAALARQLPAEGVTVVRFEQPWRVAGRKVAVRPALLDEAWLAAVGLLRLTLGPGLPLVVGGRSAGARVACRTADALGAAGVVCLSFPLHPPGRPGRSRLDELMVPGVARLVLQGTRDTFGTASDVRAALPAGAPGVTVVDLPGADHGGKVARAAIPTVSELRGMVVETTLAFVRSVAGVAGSTAGETGGE